MTHPAQYFAPWFRFIARERPEIALTVLYGVRPTPEAQAEGFGRAFEWDEDLLAGYSSRVLSAQPSDTPLLAGQFSAVDAPSLDEVLPETAPDAVLVPGWHAAIYLRAMRLCRRLDVPAIYRGDSTFLSAPGGLARPFWGWHTRRRLHAYSAWLSVGTRSREYLAAFRVPEPMVFPSPHAVDNDRFAAAAAAHSEGARTAWRAARGLDPAAFVVLFAGKFTSAKRPVDVIEAVASLRNPRVQALFVGGGALEPSIRSAAAARNVTAAFAGFLNQREMPAAYAAADCLMLPSEHETWGLVVNEAMATGLPCVVSDQAGCAPDLVTAGETGETVPRGRPDLLGAAIDTIRRRVAAGRGYEAACQARVAAFSYRQATDGLVAAMTRLRQRARARLSNATGAPRILACCGNMVIAGGLERMTFEVLRVMREHGASVHVIVNTWDSRPIVALAERIDATWSTGYYRQELSSRLYNPAVLARMLWDALRTSAGLLRDARSVRPTVILMPEYHAVFRNWPALFLLRLAGIRVLMRVGVHPGPRRFHRWIWRWAISPVVERFGCNSHYFAAELAATGIAPGRIDVIVNTSSRQAPAAATVDPTSILFVGQTIPAKGLHVLFDAVAILRGRGVACRLSVAGMMDGWESPVFAGYRDRLRARAARPDLAGAVAFLDHRDDVPRLMAEAGIHCCPSLPEMREGTASVVLEAKQAGVPSVVTPTGSLVEMVEHKVDGWITRDASAEALAEVLEYFLHDPALRRQAGQAAARSSARFGPEQFERGWLGFFGHTRTRAIAVEPHAESGDNGRS